ncbi:MAG: type II secretion system protein [Verrucomicrobiota bacterium]
MKNTNKGFTLILVIMMVSIFFVLVTSFFSFSTNRLKVLQVRNASYKVDMARDSVINLVVRESIRSLHGQDQIAFKSTRPSRVQEWNLPQNRKSFYSIPSWSGSESSTLICSSGKSENRFRMERLEESGREFSDRERKIENELFWEAPALGSISEKQIPEWIYLQENGLIATNLSTLERDKSPSIRFGFALYDIGGLLDIQLAGRGSIQRDLRASGNPTVAYADLSQLPGFSPEMQDELVRFRGGKITRDLQSVENQRSGFEQRYQTNGLVGSALGENGFTSRQDLLAFFKSKGWSTESLKYLTTFSRSSEHPLFRYDSKWKNSLTNKKWADLKVQTEFQRLYGERSIKGEPLLKRYFPLSWISKLETEDAGWVERAFGLKKNGDFWIYTSGTGSEATSILGMDEISVLGREPNFFELLKLGITEGSLGVHAGDDGARAKIIDQVADYQIIRIGANMIDQFDSNHEPTIIHFAREEFYGVEDLPSINKISHRPYVPGGTMAASLPIYFLMLPEYWNAHRKLNKPVSTDPYPDIRLRAYSGALAQMYQYTNNTTLQNYLTTSLPTTPATLSARSLETYREPHFLRGANGLPLQNTPTGLSDISGYEFDFTTFPATVDANNYTNVYVKYSNVVLMTEYKNSKGNWMPYNVFAGLANGSGVLNSKNGIHPATANGTVTTSADAQSFRVAGRFIDSTKAMQAFIKSDPRTTRFGVAFMDRLGDTQGSPSVFCELSLRPETSSKITQCYDSKIGFIGNNFHLWLNETGKYFGVPTSYTGMYASMAENRYTYSSATPETYPDIDGIQRWGDYALDGNPYQTTQKINPYKQNEQTYRPIILDRPCRSVGELGYTDRDMPWKSLDFYSTNSADMVLLDLFESNEHPPVVAGKISWNVPYPEIWKSLLVGADRAYGADNPISISSDEASKIASKIFLACSSSDTPPVCRSDLVRSLTSTEVSSAWPAFKHHRESVIRQIAEVGQSSTVNFMMDLVVEDGKSRKGSNQKVEFKAQGRRRYWVFVAIDRMTYEIIDMKIEEVL